jgi:hypothetical protein
MASKTTTSNAAAAMSPCMTRGPEIPRPGGVITVPFEGSVQFLLLSCFSPGNLIVRLGPLGELVPSSTVLMDQTVPPPNPVTITLPSLAKGRYLLHWSFLPGTNPWQIVIEISVDGVIKFRQLKHDGGNIPLPTGFMVLEVV